MQVIVIYIKPANLNFIIIKVSLKILYILVIVIYNSYINLL